MNSLADKDHRFLWHPFTQMKDWVAEEPVIIESGRSAVLRDTNGNEYLDANSSIWTNLHGHGHPKITQAIKDQLDQIAHSSFLGLSNAP
ncbi:MAG: aminotransferase class III-fold pyridoxal phosphate-dependent enzyme, partial [Verrucomicrobiia bacterium]